MTTNNELYKNILAILTGSEDIAPNTSLYYMKCIAEYYECTYTNQECSNRYIKDFAEGVTGNTYTESHTNNSYLTDIAEYLTSDTYVDYTENQLLVIIKDNISATPSTVTGISLALGSSTIEQDGSTNLTATLSGEDLEGLEVTFKVNGVVIGSRTTNASGVAVYENYTQSNIGRYIITASYRRFSDDKTLTVTERVLYNDITLTSTKSTLSYYDEDYAILTAQLQLNGSPVQIDDVNITIKVDNTIIGTFDTINGAVTYRYDSEGVGDIIVTAYVTERTSLIQTYSIQDYLYVPKLDGTDAITSWTSMTNKTENGIFYSHGSFLTGEWSNEGLWQLDFDVMCSSWRYIGLMPICSEEINPYTDAKVTNYAMITWEGISYMGGLGASVVEEDTMSKITNSQWHHITIKKLSSTQVKITIDNTYNSIRNVPNLANLTTLHIGSRDNPSARNSGGIIQYKNIQVKPL